MTDKPERPPWIVPLLVTQQVVSIFFVIGAICFPFYTLYRHGLSALPVYDGSGNVIRHSSYFLISLAASAFALIISGICFTAARNALRQLRNGK